MLAGGPSGVRNVRFSNPFVTRQVERGTSPDSPMTKGLKRANLRGGRREKKKVLKGLFGGIHCCW